MQKSEVVLGIYRSPADFFREAARVRHPIDLESNIPDEVKRSIFFLLCNDAVTVCRTRLHRLQELQKMAIDLDMQIPLFSPSLTLLSDKC